jgi:hypothetical protein
VRHNVSEEIVAYIIRAKRIKELGKLAVSSHRCTLQRITNSAFLRCASVASYSQRSWLAYSFHPDDGSDKFLRNVGSHKSHAVSYPRRRHSSTQALIASLVQWTYCRISCISESYTVWLLEHVMQSGERKPTFREKCFFNVQGQVYVKQRIGMKQIFYTDFLLGLVANAFVTLTEAQSTRGRTIHHYGTLWRIHGTTCYRTGTTDRKRKSAVSNNKNTSTVVLRVVRCDKTGSQSQM